MKKKIKNTTFVVIGFVILYSFFAGSLSNYLTSRYDYKMNEKRNELDLVLIGKDWVLDSTYKDSVFQDYWQHWKPKTTNKNKPYYSHKNIVYNTGFWFWENYLLGEADYYVNPINDLQYAELRIIYDFLTEEWYCGLDTLETELKKQKDQALLDSLLVKGGSYCEDMDLDLNYDTIGLTKDQATIILKKWEIE